MIVVSLMLQVTLDLDKVSVSTFSIPSTISLFFSKGLFRKHIYKIFVNAFQVFRMTEKKNSVEILIIFWIHGGL